MATGRGGKSSTARPTEASRSPRSRDAARANEAHEVIRFLSSDAFLQSLSPQDLARLE